MLLKFFYSEKGYPKFKCKDKRDSCKTNDKSVYKNEKIKSNIDIKKKRLQRALSRKIKGSKNYNKVIIQRLYLKIKAAKKHLIHDITNKLIEENDIMVTEGLGIKSMY